MIEIAIYIKAEQLWTAAGSGGDSGSDLPSQCRSTSVQN